MDDQKIARVPVALEAIEDETARLGFDMPSERQTGSFLRTLVSGKPSGRILEIGTGTGLATAWMLDGLDTGGRIVSIDVDQDASGVAGRNLGGDARLHLIVSDALKWIGAYDGEPFDVIFADAMVGKYEGFELAWRNLAISGSYVIDDMLPQANWPDGHAANVTRLLSELDARADCQLVRMNWASGLVLVTKTA